MFTVYRFSRPHPSTIYSINWQICNNHQQPLSIKHQWLVVAGASSPQSFGRHEVWQKKQLITDHPDVLRFLNQKGKVFKKFAETHIWLHWLDAIAVTILLFYSLEIVTSILKMWYSTMHFITKTRNLGVKIEAVTYRINEPL